ncbi:hypothetical protein D3C71_1802190 [compost metagenome]
MMLLVFLREPERRLLCHCTDGSCTEYIVRAKHRFGEVMGIGLVLSGEVKVDIGNLIPFKAQEGLERNILPFPFQITSAVRTSFVRQVKPARHTAVEEPLTVPAFGIGANIMSRQRINLRNTKEGCNNR